MIAENVSVVSYIIKNTEQCKVCMQIAWLKLKLFDQAADSECLHGNVEEKWRVQCHKMFDSFLSYTTAVINSFKPIVIQMDNVSEEYFISP